ncbi:MAG: cache domain-containing protein [Pseudomonas marincola]
MFKKISLGLIMGLFLAVGFASADEKKPHVLSMMDAAVKHYGDVGQDQAFKDFNQPGDYKNGEFYIMVQSLTDDKILFHGANAKLVGRNLTGLKDTDGKAFVKELSETAKGAGKGWVSYKWPHPETKKIAQKHSYVSRVGDVMLMIGYYE